MIGSKSLLMKNQQNYIQRDILIKSDKSLIISLPATRYNPGDVITATGTGLPSKDVTMIVKDDQNKIIHYEILDGRSSGNINFEYTSDELATSGTYTLIANQEGESDVNLFGIGQYPTSQIVVLMDKKSYISSSTAQINIIGPPSSSLMLVVIDPSDNNKFSDIITTNSQGKIKYALDVNNYASGVYQIVVTKGNVQDSTQFSIGLQTASGPITLNTSKQVYIPGERIILIGQTGNESLITITLFDPSGNIFGKSEVFSSFDGNFSSEELGFPVNADLGTWKVTAHSKLNSATHEITLSETSQLVLSLLIEKTEFNVGETMMIKGVGPTTSSHIDIKIIDVNGLPGFSGGISDGGNAAGSGGGKDDNTGRSGNLADSVVNSALRYRAHQPFLDSLLKEIGMNPGEISNIRNILGDYDDPKKDFHMNFDKDPTKSVTSKKNPNK